MTYLSFLSLFLLPVLIVVSCIFFKTYSKNKFRLKGIIILVLIAVIYTTPWDSFIIKNGIWYYDENKILGTIFRIPIEEYLFMIVQTLISSMLYCIVQKNKIAESFSYSPKYLILFGIIFFIGVMMIRVEYFKYFGYLITWASIPLAIQWSVGSNQLIGSFKKWLLPFILFSIYLAFIDCIAIKNNVWTIAESTSCGINLFGLPIEELVFFLLTNLLVFQGMTLWDVLKND